MTIERAHPITLKTLVFTRSLVEAVPDHRQSEAPITIHPENSLDVSKVAGTEREWVGTMSSIFNASMDKGAPYHFDIHCMAIFNADESLSEAEAQRGVTITANNVLYGAIRESVAWLTGRQPYGPFLLGLSVLRPTQLAAKEATAP